MLSYYSRVTTFLLVHLVLNLRPVSDERFLKFFNKVQLRSKPKLFIDLKIRAFYDVAKYACITDTTCFEVISQVR